MTSSPELPRGNQKHIIETAPKKSEQKPKSEPKPKKEKPVKPPKPTKEKLKLQNFKTDEATRQAFKANADKYTGGCISKWLKLAGTKYEPAK